MMRARTTWGLLISSLLLGVALVPAPAHSAADTTPPTLNAPLKSSFTVGRQIPVGTVPFCGDGEPWDLRMMFAENFTWTGSDNSGTVHYDLVQNTGAAGAEDVFQNSSQTSYSGDGLGTNDDQWCGGGSNSIYEWNLTARDAAGNATTRNVYGGRVRLTQDSNLADLAEYATKPQITYTGAWRTSSCACWSHGDVHKATAAGAAATIVVPLPFTQFPAGVSNSYTHVGLVMHKGPDRGKFKVYVNGTLKGTVDTYAATSQPRMVVWQTAVGGVGAGNATIRIVNEATPGRTRVDLDAVLTN